MVSLESDMAKKMGKNQFGERWSVAEVLGPCRGVENGVEGLMTWQKRNRDAWDSCGVCRS